MQVCITAQLWKSEASWREPVLSFHCVDSRTELKLSIWAAKHIKPIELSPRLERSS